MPMQIDGKEVSGMWVAAPEGVPADGLTHQLHLNGPEYGVDYTAPTGTFSNANPGTIGTDYHYDGLASMQYLRSRGWRVVKLPIRWERIQPVLNAPLDAGELGRLSTFVGHCQAAGLKINLDIHNYGLYYRDVSGTGTRTIIGSAEVPISAFVDLWRRLATAFADSGTVTIYNLCAEPQGDYGGLTAAVWHEASQAAVSAIREVDTVTEIHVAGFGWSSLRWWVNNNGGAGWVTDPHDNFRYVAHHYWDSDGSGSYSTTYASNLTTATSENHTRPGSHDALHARVLNDLDAWNSWLTSAGARGIVGEIGWPHSTDASSWGGLAEVYYTRLSELGIPAALWTAGEWADWAELSAYEGQPISGVRSSGLLAEGYLEASSPQAFRAAQSAHIWDEGWRQVWSALPLSGGRYAWAGSTGRVPESGNLPAGLTPLITHTVTAPGTTTASVTVTFDYEWPDVEATIELAKNGAVIGTRVPDLTPTQSLTVMDFTVATGDIIELRIKSDTEFGAWYPVLSSSLALA